MSEPERVDADATIKAEDDVLKSEDLGEPVVVSPDPAKIEPKPEPKPIAKPEPKVEPKSESILPRDTVSAAPVAKTKSGAGGFIGTVLGGLIAAAAGYAVAIYAPIPALTKPAIDPAELMALTSRVQALEQRPQEDTGLVSRVSALENQPKPDLPPATDLTPLQNGLSELTARLQQLEQRPLAPGEGISPQQVEAIRQDLTSGIEAKAAEAEKRLAAAEAQADQLGAAASQTARKIAQRAALGQLQVALDSGQSFAGALGELALPDLPQVLKANAASGLPTLPMLAAYFPAASREALAASLKADMGASWGQRFTSFLQTTSGARSLTPREGSDPDAILSRAEAAVQAGDLSKALTEIAALPAEGQAAMAAWVAEAQLRLEAQAAVATLAKTLGE